MIDDAEAPARATSPPATVDVVIPYYRNQPGLDRILAALRSQSGLERTGLAGPPRIIVADDGSPTPPRVPSEVTVVHQADEGFRASAARHLGARAGSGDILLFLDGDTVPGPGYIAAMCAALAGRPDLLAVGRRRYARVTGGPEGPDPADILPDPPWPASFYAETENLTSGDDLWRGVISAVFGLHRRLYDLAGGFDPDIVGYGGEDWDLAWRCEQAGGRLLHVPDAVGWHDGPDWSGRSTDGGIAEKTAAKNVETARLAPLIASPLTRPAAGIFALPMIAVHVHAGGPAFTGSGATAATVASLLSWHDVAVTVDPGTPDADLIAELFSADPRVSVGGDADADASAGADADAGTGTGADADAGVGSGPHGRWERWAGQGEGPRRRPPILVDIHHPCALEDLDARRLRALCPPVGATTLEDARGRPLATVRSARAAARDQEWGDRPPGTAPIAGATVGIAPLGEPGQAIQLERILGGW